MVEMRDGPGNCCLGYTMLVVVVAARHGGSGRNGRVVEIKEGLESGVYGVVVGNMLTVGTVGVGVGSVVVVWCG